MTAAASWERSFRGGERLGKKCLCFFGGQNQAHRSKSFAFRYADLIFAKVTAGSPCYSSVLGWVVNYIQKVQTVDSQRQMVHQLRYVFRM